MAGADLMSISPDDKGVLGRTAENATAAGELIAVDLDWLGCFLRQLNQPLFWSRPLLCWVENETRAQTKCEAAELAMHAANGRMISLLLTASSFFRFRVCRNGQAGEGGKPRPRIQIFSLFAQIAKSDLYILYPIFHIVDLGECVDHGLTILPVPRCSTARNRNFHAAPFRFIKPFINCQQSIGKRFLHGVAFGYAACQIGNSTQISAAVFFIDGSDDYCILAHRLSLFAFSERCA